jgi:Tfp pilus assembly protein PilO
MFKYYKNLDDQLMLAKARLRESLAVIKEKGQIDSEYAAYEERLRFKGSQEQEITQLLNGLEILANNANIKIVNMKPRTPQDKNFYMRFAVEVETESNMSSLMRFIYDLKNSSLLLRIDRLNLNTKTSQNNTVILASMVISKIAIK